MKPYVKEYNERITSKFLLKDVTISFLIILLILTNEWFAFASIFQWVMSIPFLWLALTALLFTYDSSKLRMMARVLIRNIDEQITEEIIENNDNEDIA